VDSLVNINFSFPKFRKELITAVNPLLKLVILTFGKHTWNNSREQLDRVVGLLLEGHKAVSNLLDKDPQCAVEVGLYILCP
jgi:hypothetical protein